VSSFLLLAVLLAAEPQPATLPANNPVVAQRAAQPRARTAARPQPGPAAGGSIDNGDALADLIQTTVAPNSWQRAGGRGTIYYWRPGRALVVRATDGTHDDIADVMRQLNRAGR
jgi:general secretion pathway protein D